MVDVADARPGLRACSHPVVAADRISAAASSSGIPCARGRGIDTHSEVGDVGADLALDRDGAMIR